MAFSEVTKKHRGIFESKQLSTVKSHKPPGISDFEIIKPISRGAFGQVYLARRKGSQKCYALKAMKKSDVLTKNMMEQVVAERDALAISSRSPFVVQLYYSFQSEEKIFFVMDYMIGGDVKSLLHNIGYFHERMAKFYVAEVTLALEYLHGHFIYHRDIKPDNMLLSNTGHIKLTDFGLSCLTSARKPNFLDLINTPGESSQPNYDKASKVFWRTPGQLQSLTSKFSFSIPRKKGRYNKYQSDSMSDASSLKDSKAEFVFSPPQTFSSTVQLMNTSLFSTPCSRRGSSAPNITKMDLSQESPIVISAASSGLTHDINSLAINTFQRKRNHIHIDQDEEKDNVFVDTGHCHKRVRVYSQSMPCGLETSSEVMTCVEENIKTNMVTFNDKVHRCEDSSNENDSQISITVSNHENESQNFIEHSLHDNSANGNISGVTALTETSHMSITSTFDSDMVSPHNKQVHLQTSGNSQVNTAKFTPSPQCIDKTDKCSSSVTPNNVYQRDHLNSEIIITPNQVLKFFEGPSPHENTCSEMSLQESFTKCTPEGITCSTVAETPRQTPFRTPKSCLRGKATPAERRRILGTPDYLAPEILLGREHGAPVDWWALGICFYEFLTGIPPFNDDTPELVFQHILAHHLIWPEGEESLSDTTVNAISAMLNVNPDGRPKAEDVKRMPCFLNLCWANLHDEESPFIPQPDDVYDTTYFNARNHANHFKMSTFKP